MLLSVCLTGCAEKTDEEAVEDISKKASKSAMTLSLYLLSEEAVEKCGANLKLVYTPVHGSGYKPVTAILKLPASRIPLKYLPPSVACELSIDVSVNSNAPEDELSVSSRTIVPEPSISDKFGVTP